MKKISLRKIINLSEAAANGDTLADQELESMARAEGYETSAKYLQSWHSAMMNVIDAAEGTQDDDRAIAKLFLDRRKQFANDPILGPLLEEAEEMSYDDYHQRYKPKVTIYALKSTVPPVSDALAAGKAQTKKQTPQQVAQTKRRDVLRAHIASCPPHDLPTLRALKSLLRVCSINTVRDDVRAVTGMTWDEYKAHRGKGINTIS